MVVGLIFPALPTVAAAQEPARIVVIGDSWSSGYGLAEGEGFVPQLESWLRANGAPGATVVNGAVAGQTTRSARIGFDARLMSGTDAMVLQLGGNDNSRDVTKGQSRANLHAMIDAAQDKGIAVLLVGGFATPNRLPEVRAEFDSMFPEIAQAEGVRLYPSFYHVFADQLADVPRDMLQSDGDHPKPEAIGQIVADMGPAILDVLAEARGGN